ncbi:MAG: hypothetical protein MK116_08275 [Phycisphaerales bacterium]|nr:hypothetical protein [Phycisphaerales bacterium]
MNSYRTFASRGAGQSNQSRRGNSIILVVGLIMLLLIVAISYITRAQSVRSTAAAYRESTVRDLSVDSVAEDLAAEIAGSLFVRPIEMRTEDGEVLAEPVDEMVRLQPDEDAGRYGVDPNFAWNHAPYDVVPWTNPPDWLTYENQTGLQAELHLAGSVYATDDVWKDLTLGTHQRAGNRIAVPPRANPRGGPGIADTRWLRDTEPQRFATDHFREADGLDASDGSSFGFLDKVADAFSHYRHLSNISRPENEWRIVRDIADVTGARSGDAGWDDVLQIHTRGNWDWGSDWELSSLDGHHYHGGLVDRLDIPVEQWPVQAPTINGERITGTETNSFQPTGQSVFTNDVDFWTRWNAWFHPWGYRDNMVAAAGYPGPNGLEFPDGDLLPPNFYDLSDLDGDGQDGEYFDREISGKLGEKPEDEFLKGTARWHVGRVLTDSDGDGFTDSFWWLSPHTAPGGLKQVVGVSITDNSSRLNVNVATRGIRNDAGSQEGTRGWTPADLALMGQGTPPWEYPWGITGASSAAFLEPNSDPELDVWSVGFFDNRANWSGLLDSDTDSDDWLTYPDAFIERTSSSTDTSEASVGFDPEAFTGSGGLQDLMSELGIEYNQAFPDGGRDIHDRDNRLFYFQEAGLDPFNPGSFFTPFGTGEEIELRAYEGNNLPWLYGRFEQVMNPEWSRSPFNGDTSPAFLRSGQDREETSPLHEQLSNRQLLADNRRKLTFFNSARNDTMPPWLWAENRFSRMSLSDTVMRRGVWGEEIDTDPALRDVNRDGVADDGFPRFVPYARELLDLPPAMVGTSAAWAPDGDISSSQPESWYRELWDQYHAQMRQKIDLREWEQPSPGRPLSLNTDVTSYEPMPLSQRLPMALFMALTSGELNDSWRDRYLQGGSDYASRTTRDSVYGTGNVQIGSSGAMSGGSGGSSSVRHYSGDHRIEQSRQTAAMLAANMLAWRDSDVDAPLYSMQWTDQNNQPRGDMGPVMLPRLDGWVANTDQDDPAHDENYGAWRPFVEDMFIDGRVDDDRVNDTQIYNGLFLPFDADTFEGACCVNGTCTGALTVFNCEALGGYWFPATSCMGLDCSDMSAFAGGSTNVESPYVGDDFDGPGYPNLSDVTDGAWSDPGDVSGTDSNNDGWPDTYTGPEQLTRQHVRHVGAMGMEPQPFITEAFVAHVQRPLQLPIAGSTATYTGGYAVPENYVNGQWSSTYPMWALVEGDGRQITYSGSAVGPPADLGCTGDIGDGLPDFVRPSDTVAVIQIANPYDRPLPLFDRVAVPGSNGNQYFWLPKYGIRLFGQDLPLAPAQRGAGSRLVSVSSLENNNFSDNPAGSGLPLLNSPHGMVLPPATHDRPFTLTIVSLPNARFDRFDSTAGNNSRWSLQPGAEGYQWLDFLDLINTGDGRLDFPPPLQTESFEFEGVNYPVRPGDLVWVLRPNPGNQANTDEVWATNRVYYDGGWYGATAGGDVLVPGEGYEETAVGGRDTLGDLMLGPAGNGTQLTPIHAGAELVRYHRRDLNGDGDYGDTWGTNDQGAPLAFEYGTDADAIPGNNGPLPDKAVVIDRTLQWNPDRGRMEDPLLRSVTGLEWGRPYTASGSADGDSTVDTISVSSLFESSLMRERLADLGSHGDWPLPTIICPPLPGQTEDQIIENDVMFPDMPEPDTTDSDDDFEFSSYSGKEYRWNLFDNHSEDQEAWGWASKFKDKSENNMYLPGEAVEAAELASDSYRKAGETRWIQWSRYARPWGIDPDWPYHGPANDSAVLQPGDAVTSLNHYDGPRHQMDWSAPRYVLGEGQVTKSFGRKWASAVNTVPPAKPVDDWGNTAPLLLPNYFPQQDDNFQWNAGAMGTQYNSTAMLFAEQTVDYVNTPRPQWGEFNGPQLTNGSNLSVYIKVIEDNDLYMVQPPAGVSLTHPDLERDDTTQSHYPEMTRMKDVTRIHGDLVHIDLPYLQFDGSNMGGIGGGGGGGGGGTLPYFDPDGDQFHDVGDPPQYFPWLSRNQRMPRVFQDIPANPTTPRIGFVYRNRKPTAFDMIAGENYEVDENSRTAYDDSVNPWSFPDKGVYSTAEMPRYDLPISSIGPIPFAGQGVGGADPLDEGYLAPFSFQMNHKDGNFEQIGEVLNVWTHAHLVSMPWLDGHYPGQAGVEPRPDPVAPVHTISTFSESLARELSDTQRAARPWLTRRFWEQQFGGTFGHDESWLWSYRDLMRDALRRVGRLEVSPSAYGRSSLVGEPIQDFPGIVPLDLGQNTLDPWIRPNGEVSHLEPEQPAGQRVLDLFVCDGPGVYDLFNNASIAQSSDPSDWVVFPDGIVDPEDSFQVYRGRDPSFMNAHGFSGKGTPGLVNINTAPVEVMRALPHMYRLVHGGVGYQGSGSNVLDVNANNGDAANRNPRVAVADAMVQYRDGLGMLRTAGGAPVDLAPFAGARDTYLAPAFEPDLDANGDDEIEAAELALASGIAAGPYYGSRGSHTPESNANSYRRWNLESMHVWPQAFRPSAGDNDYEYDQDGDGFADDVEADGSDVIYPPDGIATGRGTRGFKSIGELFQLETPGGRRVGDDYDLVGEFTDPRSWQIDFAARRPFHVIADGLDGSSTPLQDHRFQFGYPAYPLSTGDIGAVLSTDTSEIRDSSGGGVQRFIGRPPTWDRIATNDMRRRERMLGGDMVAGDAEEANLLFSGMSNMITTRSDMFTVHFRVRTFKPNPETGVWDATDPDAIVDDSRYVMLVDRSEVERPGDKPRIVYMEKIEN